MQAATPNYRFYSPSGSFSANGAITTLIMGVVSAILTAFIYAFGVYHIPSVYLGALLTLAFGWLIGYSVAFGVHKFEIRNVTVATIIAFISAIIGYSVHWFVYLATVAASSVETPYDFGLILSVSLDYAKNPLEAWEFVKMIYEEGMWSFSRSSSGAAITVSGIYLGIIWFCEFVAIIYMSVSSARSKAEKPYSEILCRWIEPVDMPLPIQYIEKDSFKSAVERNDFSQLSTATLAAEGLNENAEIKYAQVTVYPDELNSYVSIVNVVRRGKKKEKTKEVIKFLSVPSEAAKKIMENLK